MDVLPNPSRQPSCPTRPNADAMPRPTPEPAPAGVESVWDYPRPPAVESTELPVRVEFAGQVVAATTRALRVLETSLPPSYYVPPEDVRLDLLEPVEETTRCEWKGRARYLDLAVDGRRSERAAWTYPDPTPGYRAIADHVAFHPARVDRALVDGEEARAQEGGFYGGWITRHVAGPFKGGPGTETW